MEFEWDAKKNLRKHKVSIIEAATVFGDFLGATAADPLMNPDRKRNKSL